MQKKVRFLYFDLGGVMFHYNGGLIELTKENGLTIEDFNKVFNKYEHKIAVGEMTLQELWEEYKQALCLNNSVHLDFLEYWVSHFVPIYETHTLVQELALQYPIGILSNLYLGTLEKIQEKKYIPNIQYSTIILSCEVKSAKPDKEIYKIAQQQAKVAPQEILFIDDKEINVEAAKALGWQAIKFETNNPKASIAKLKKLVIN